MDTPRPRSPQQPVTVPALAALSLNGNSASTPDNSEPPTPRPSSPQHRHSFHPEAGHFPPEIIALILSHLSLPYHPSLNPSSDPTLEFAPSLYSHSQPTLAKPTSEQTHETFRAVSLVDRTWGEEGQRLLWTEVGFGTPKDFESVLRTVEEYRNGETSRRRKHGKEVDAGWKEAGESGFSIRSDGSDNGGRPAEGEEEERGRRPSITLSFEDVPSWSEDGKWSAMSGSGRKDGMMVDDGTPDVLRSLSADAYPLLSLHPLASPLLATRILSFSRFRTAGLRRSLRQSSHERFVTPHRLLFLLRGTRLSQAPLKLPFSVIGTAEEDSVMSDSGDEDDEASDQDEEKGAGRGKGKAKLEAVGFTEFMDSAISRKVLEELLFRGGYLAEYEEEIVPTHHQALEGLDIPPSPRPGAIPLPPATKPFLARQLQPSRSRSRNRPHNHRHLHQISPTLNIDDSVNGEESGDDEDAAANSDTDSSSLMEFEDEVLGEQEEDRGRGRTSKPQNRIVAPTFQRRGSGSAFASPVIGGTASASGVPRDESEERGRTRPRGGGGPGQSGRGRSLLPPSAYGNRSSSVPAAFLQRRSSTASSGIRSRQPRAPPRALSIDTERSSSVPASARGGMSGKTRIVRVLEGSTEVRAIRALDLCGCVSGAFITALAEVITNYGLGPKGLVLNGGTITTIGEDGEESEDGSSMEYGYSGEEDRGGRKLRKVLFPHLRRLGLASALLPASHLVALVLSFPFLTHLDLTSTLASPVILKYLALAGQSGPGGRKMRLKALSLARCRLLTGAAILGLFCGDCPPFTSIAGLRTIGDMADDENESWGSGEVVADLIDVSLYGDSTYPSPLSPPELRLVLTISPAFIGGHLRTIDLSSTPLTDKLLLEHFPPQPHLIELGLAHCRFITIKAIATFLIEKAPGVEILDLSHSCQAPAIVVPSSAARRTTTGGASHLSIMELHTILLGRAASSQASSANVDEAAMMVGSRRTNLRVVELDEKTLEAVQGGAGDWKAIWGKGRRGWYVDTAVSSVPRPSSGRPRTLVHLPRTDMRRQALLRLSQLNGVVPGDMGWHTRKMEVLKGEGMMGREDGLYAFHAYQI